MLRKNPGLKPHIAEATEGAYKNARVEAAVETGLRETIFPKLCPYGWSEITARPIDWPDA